MNHKIKLVIFGAGKIAEVVSDYFYRDSDYEIVAYSPPGGFEPR